MQVLKKAQLHKLNAIFRAADKLNEVCKIACACMCVCSCVSACLRECVCGRERLYRSIFVSMHSILTCTYTLHTDTLNTCKY